LRIVCTKILGKYGTIGGYEMIESDPVTDVVKRGVTALPPWRGWDWFMGYYQRAHRAPYPKDSKLHRAPYPKDSKLYFTTLFQTGCRRAEAVLIETDDIYYNEEGIAIYNVPVLKKHWLVKRTILIKNDPRNVLYPHFLKMVRDAEGHYLLYGRQKFTRARARILCDHCTESRITASKTKRNSGKRAQ
jgi:integrase